MLEVFSPLQQTSMSHLRLAAQLWRRVCALSRAHRQAAEELLCSCCLPIKLEAPSCFTHPSCSRLQAWQQLVASREHSRCLALLAQLAAPCATCHSQKGCLPLA